MGFSLAPSWLPGLVILGALILQIVFVLGHTIRPKYRRLHGWRAPLIALRNSLLPTLPTQLYLWGTLILLLLVLWWISSGIMAVLHRVLSPDLWLSETILLVVIVVAVHLWFLLRGFSGRHMNRAFHSSASTDEQSPAATKRVAVIGAGMAGLVAAKELKEEGHEVVVFERTNDWGGVWAQTKQRGGTAWADTITSTGSLNTTFSDSLFPIHHPENGQTPLHFTRQQFYDMLRSYEKQHNVFDGDNLRCEAEVTGMRQEGDRWHLEIKQSQTGDVVEETFDAVTICTGLNHQSWSPTVEGSERFSGQQFHVEGYDHDADRYRGKKVLVIGTGETSADLVKELDAGGAEHIYVAQRGSTITLPRNYTTLPPDYTENRFTYSGPMFNRWGILFTSSPIMMAPLVLPTRVRPPNGLYWIMLFNPFRAIKKFPSVFGGASATKADGLWFSLANKRASLIGTVAAISENGAVLASGRQLDVDVIIHCTGYRTDNAFLPPANGQVSTALTARDLYKLTIHPDYHNVAFVGFARGQIGALTISSELQARWWALLVSEKRQLPGRDEMHRHIDYLRGKSRRFSQPTRTTMTLANSLARQDIGCEPDMFALFRSDRRLWFRVWTGVICNAHFRLFGVHAKPEVAGAQLLQPGAFSDPDYIDSLDIVFNTIPLVAFQIPLWAALEKLVPTFQFRSALRSYV